MAGGGGEVLDFGGGEDAEVTAGDVADGDGGDLTEGNDHALAAVDALDDAPDSGEVTVHDLDIEPLTEGVFEVVHVGDTVVVDGGDANEVVHLAVGDVEGLGEGLLVVVDLVHDISDIVETGLALDFTELLVGGADEDDVVDGGHELHREAYLAVGHRDVVLHLELVELFFEPYQTGVVGIADPQGEPILQVSVDHERWRWARNTS